MSLPIQLGPDVNTWPPALAERYRERLKARRSTDNSERLLKIYGGDSPKSASAALDRVAREVNVPQDSLSRFLTAGYVPQPRQLIFHAAARECDQPGGPTRVGIGGARGGAKSHALLAQVVIDDCQRVEGLKFLILRKVLKAARESFDDLRRKVLMGVNHNYRRKEGLLILPNDSRVILGHYQTEKDIEAYLGLEYDGVGIEEGTQLSEDKVKDIASCIRTSKTNWRPREYYTTNPGGIGHVWFKRDFIEPARKGHETTTRFIFSNHKDNAFLNPDYEANLNRLTGWKLRAWRDGDWDIAAGQYFSTWSRDAVVKKDLRVMPGAEVWCSLDYGFQHPTVCQLFSKYDGKSQVIDEHWRRHALVSENVDDIKNMLARHGVKVQQLREFLAGPDVFAKRGNESGKTIADEYSDLGIKLTAANTDRVNGAGYLLKLLGNPLGSPEIAPQVEISDRCTRLIECLPAMQHDPHRPEDVLKTDIDEDGEGGDDCFVASTLILTESGYHPIEQLIVGERVMTRAGLRRIKALWKSRLRATVLQVTLSDGRTITGTPNHPFWVKNSGWMALDTLRYGDILTTCARPLFPNQLPLTELSSDAIQTRRRQATEGITLRMATTLNAECERFMLKYGNQFTVQFLRELISTMRMKIRSTTQLRIWFASLRQNTLRNTLRALNAWLQPASTLRRFDLWHPLGIPLLMAVSGTENTARLFGTADSQLSEAATSAANPIARSLLHVLDSVAISVSQGGVGRPGWITPQNPVRNVATRSPQTDMRISDFVRGGARDLRFLEVVEGKKSDTFAIHVEGQHEYYANGLLVKNCYDCARYGLNSERNTKDRYSEKDSQSWSTQSY